MNKLSIHQKLRREGYWLLGSLFVLIACVWPIRTLQALSKQQMKLEQQGMQVRVLAQEAQQLLAQVEPVAAERASALQLPMWVGQRLGEKASVVVSGDVAVLTLRDVPSEQFVRVLTDLRQELQVQVKALRLTVNAGAIAGRVELNLPQES